MNFYSVLWRPVSLSFSLLCVLGDYGSLELLFRKNWVGSEMAGMKIAFFAIFNPKWVKRLSWYPSKMVFLANLAFNFQSDIL